MDSRWPRRGNFQEEIVLEAKRTSVPGLSRQEDPFPALEEDVMSLFSSSSLEPSESPRDEGESVSSRRQEPCSELCLMIPQPSLAEREGQPIMWSHQGR